jgi:hypothetical protein
MPNFPGSEQWMIGSGYELLVISSIGGPNLNELSVPIHNSRPDPMLDHCRDVLLPAVACTVFRYRGAVDSGENPVCGAF